MKKPQSVGSIKDHADLAQNSANGVFDRKREISGNSMELVKSVAAMQEKFIATMDDDFNTAQAMAYLFEISHLINSFVAGADPHSDSKQAMLQKALQVFKDLGGILGIFMKSEDDRQQVVDDILALLLEVRNSARHEKNYALADEVRNLFQKMQIKVEDKAMAVSVVMIQLLKWENCWQYD